MSNAETSPNLSSLLLRVEGATGADRELSSLLWFSLVADRECLWGLSGLNAQRGPRQNTEKDLLRDVLREPHYYGFDAEDDYTASLDAALALCERVLPGAGWLCGVKSDGGFMAELFRTRYISGVIPRLAYATAKTPALALVSATLKALIAAKQGRAA